MEIGEERIMKIMEIREVNDGFVVHYDSPIGSETNVYTDYCELERQVRLAFAPDHVAYPDESDKTEKKE